MSLKYLWYKFWYAFCLELLNRGASAEPVVPIAAEPKPEEDDDEDDSDFIPSIVSILKDFEEAENLRIFNRTHFKCDVCMEEKIGKQCLKFVGKRRCIKRTLIGQG
jgi:hypothetical protein